jgi:hypothetical protein
MRGIVYEQSLGSFLLVTAVLNGGAAWLAGRAIAQTWRVWPWVIVYSLLIGAAARFIHYALFSGTLLSPHYYALDAGVAVMAGLLGFRHARAGQIATQYAFLFRRRGWFGWARQDAASPRQSRRPG